MNRSTETQVTPPAIIQLAKTDVGKCVSINIEIPKPKRVQITFLATKPKVYADPIFFRPFILHILPMGKEMFVCLDKMDEVYPKGLYFPSLTIWMTDALWRAEI